MASSLWLPTKQKIRSGLKQTKHFLRGDVFRFTNQQETLHRHQYPHLWSQFVTSIPQRSGAKTMGANRLKNLHVAGEYIDGLILKTNQIFSFWHRVPRPTLKNGYREGPAFFNGTVTKDIGGGLCLLSTNLFNTFLLAGCEILERFNHSIDPYGDRRFFPLGRDATVFYGYKDLIVSNQQEIELQLELEIFESQGKVRSTLWGTRPNPVTLKIESSFINEKPAPSPQGMPGYQVETIRLSTSSDSVTGTDSSWHQDYRAMSTYQPCHYAYYPHHHSSTTV